MDCIPNFETFPSPSFLPYAEQHRVPVSACFSNFYSSLTSSPECNAIYYTTLFFFFYIHIYISTRIGASERINKWNGKFQSVENKFHHPKLPFIQSVQSYSQSQEVEMCCYLVVRKLPEFG
jgi:hypothetical protein